MSKKKREHGREYNGKKREHEYYKYRTTIGKRESTNTMASIGLQLVGHISLCALFSVRRNASLNFISLYIQYDNVAMYQNYIHDVIAKYVVLIRSISLKKSFITLTKLSYIGACIFNLSLVLIEQFHMHS